MQCRAADEKLAVKHGIDFANRISSLDHPEHVISKSAVYIVVHGFGSGRLRKRSYVGCYQPYCKCRKRVVIFRHSGDAGIIISSRRLLDHYDDVSDKLVRVYRRHLNELLEFIIRELCGCYPGYLISLVALILCNFDPYGCSTAFFDTVC